MADAERFHGLEIGVRRASGAAAVRVLHPAGQVIEAHRHNWPFLMLPRLGGCTEAFDGGEIELDGPAVALHPAGSCHADQIGAAGLETFTIEFDPAWLKGQGELPAIRESRYWTGGAVVAAAGRLRRVWEDGAEEPALAASVGAFLRLAATPRTSSATAPWVARVRKAVGAEPPPSTAALAARLGLHPAWLARAYRAAVGEGIGETVQRFRVERACALLRQTLTPLAEVAAAAGFCDQSHMNRAFRAVLGRTPLTVRSEGALIARFAA